MGPRVIVNGLNKVVKRAVMDQLRQGCGVGAWGWGMWMRRELVFVGKDELCEVGNGGIVVCMWMVDGEGIAEVFREGIDEDCGKVVWGKVGFKISRKDVGILESLW